jgi:hypothetical protein
VNSARSDALERKCFLVQAFPGQASSVDGTGTTLATAGGLVAFAVLGLGAALLLAAITPMPSLPGRRQGVSNNPVTESGRSGSRSVVGIHSDANRRLAFR